MRPWMLILLAISAAAAAADNALLLQPDAGNWRAGGYHDVAVLAVTDGRPVGAARFDILVSNTQIVRCVAAFGNDVRASGGLIPLCDAASATSSLTRVLSVNSWRPDAPCGTSRVATLRFDVRGLPGDSCAIALTNAVLWSTAALPTNDSAAIAPCRELALSASSAVMTVTVSGASSHSMGLTALPPTLLRGRLYPVRLAAESGGEFVSGFDATVLFPTNAVEVLDVTTLDRQQPVTWGQADGQLRLLGTKSATVWQWPGAQDLAVIWIAAKETSAGAAGQFALTNGSLFAEPALESHRLPVSNSAVAFSLTPPPQRASMASPPSTNIYLNSEFATPVTVSVTNWTPWLIGGKLTFDPSRLVVAGIEPTGFLAGATLTVDTNMFGSGLVPFVWSDFSAGNVETNGTLDLMTVRWRVTGSTLQRGTMACEVFLADGIWNGYDTARPDTNLPFLIRFSPTDMDGDGIPDWWAIRYYGGETNVAADGDTDHDRMTAWAEYVARTDPTNKNSFLGIVSIARTNTADFTVGWSSVTGVLYTLDRATNLLRGFDTIVAEGVESAGPTMTYTDTNAPNPGPVYYRVMVPAP